VLVNNAGVGSVGPVEDYTDQEIRYVFETNFFGAVRATQAVLPAMRARDGQGRS
jgi:NAD(P)-dependent dehydrogenase (short-subunit alcohol dehydrogenase family)